MAAAAALAAGQAVFAEGPTCPDAADLYEQCPNFAENGAETEYYAGSDVVLDLSAADSFTVQAQGTISRIRWWGTYLISGAGCGLFPDDFTVRFWTDVDGNPTGPDPVPTPAYTVTRASGSVGTIPVALGPAGIAEYELSFEGDGFHAQPGESFWLEIQNDYAVSGGCYWVWLTAPNPPGEGSSRQRSPSSDADWSTPSVRGFDLAFSVLSDSGEPVPTVSGWGMSVMAGAFVVAMVLMIRRRALTLNEHSGSPLASCKMFSLFLSIVGSSALTMTMSQSLRAEPVELPSDIVDVNLDSGDVSALGAGTEPVVVFSEVVTVADVFRMRFHFEQEVLSGSPDRAS